MSYEGLRRCWVNGQVGISDPFAGDTQTVVFQFRNAATTSGSITYNKNFIQPEGFGPHKVDMFLFGVNKRVFPFVRAQLVVFNGGLATTSDLPGVPIDSPDFGATTELHCTYAPMLDPYWLTENTSGWTPRLEERGVIAPPALTFKLSSAGGMKQGNISLGDDLDIAVPTLTASSGLGALGYVDNKISLVAALASGWMKPLAGKYDSNAMDGPIGHEFSFLVDPSVDIEWANIDSTGGWAIYITIEYLSTGVTGKHGGGMARISPAQGIVDRRPSLVSVQRSSLVPTVVSNTALEPVPVINEIPLTIAITPGQALPVSLGLENNYVRIDSLGQDPIPVKIAKVVDVPGDIPFGAILDQTCVRTVDGVEVLLRNDTVPVSVNAVAGDVLVEGYVPVSIGGSSGEGGIVDVNVVAAGGVALTEGKVPVTTLKNDQTGNLTNDPISVILCDLDGFALPKVDVNIASTDLAIPVRCDSPLPMVVANTPLWVADSGSDPIMAKRGLSHG